MHQQRGDQGYKDQESLATSLHVNITEVVVYKILMRNVLTHNGFHKLFAFSEIRDATLGSNINNDVSYHSILPHLCYKIIKSMCKLIPSICMPINKTTSVVGILGLLSNIYFLQQITLVSIFNLF